LGVVPKFLGSFGVQNLSKTNPVKTMGP
jgi:hypothetical protein